MSAGSGGHVVRELLGTAVEEHPMSARSHCLAKFQQ